MIPIALDRSSGVSLQEQIYRTIRDRVIDGVLTAGVRLSSSRDLAMSLGVSRNTVVLAYDWLAAEGYVEMRSGRGAYVARVVFDRPPATEAAAPIPPIEEETPDGVEAPAISTVDAARPALDLWYGRPDPRLFPAHVWRSIGAEILGACAVGLSEYGPVGGDPQLRRAIADHLAATRGIAARADQVIVTTGAQEALNLVARLLLEKGGHVVIEDPGYEAAARVFAAHGAHLHPGPVDEEGLDPTDFRGIRPRLVYVTPSHQFPTGVVMSLERRRALIEHCRRWGGLIVEDDYDGEIVFDRPPIAALAAIDRLERTIYVGSFSKTLGSGLRLGYMVVPDRLVAAAQATKSLMSYGQSWLDQQILAAFLDRGRYHRHLARLRVAYRARRDAARAGVTRLFGDRVRITGTEAGLHLCCTPVGLDVSSETLTRIARSRGVGLHPARGCGVRAETVDVAETLLIGFASLNPDEIGRAFDRLKGAFAGVLQ